MGLLGIFRHAYSNGDGLNDFGVAQADNLRDQIVSYVRENKSAIITSGLWFTYNGVTSDLSRTIETEKIISDKLGTEFMDFDMKGNLRISNFNQVNPTRDSEGYSRVVSILENSVRSYDITLLFGHAPGVNHLVNHFAGTKLEPLDSDMPEGSGYLFPTGFGSYQKIEPLKFGDYQKR